MNSLFSVSPAIAAEWPARERQSKISLLPSFSCVHIRERGDDTSQRVRSLFCHERQTHGKVRERGKNKKRGGKSDLSLDLSPLLPLRRPMPPLFPPPSPPPPPSLFSLSFYGLTSLHFTSPPDSRFPGENGKKKKRKRGRNECPGERFNEIFMQD